MLGEEGRLSNQTCNIPIAIDFSQKNMMDIAERDGRHYSSRKKRQSRSDFGHAVSGILNRDWYTSENSRLEDFELMTEGSHLLGHRDLRDVVQQHRSDCVVLVLLGGMLAVGLNDQRLAIEVFVLTAIPACFLFRKLLTLVAKVRANPANNYLEELVRPLPGILQDGKFLGRMQDGSSYVVWHKQQERKEENELSLSVLVDGCEALSISTGQPRSGLLRALGCRKIARSGDLVFDRRWVAESIGSASSGGVLSSASVRRLLASVFVDGFEEVCLSNKAIIARMLKRSTQEKFSSYRLYASAETLAQLSQDVGAYSKCRCKLVRVKRFATLVGAVIIAVAAVTFYCEMTLHFSAVDAALLLVGAFVPAIPITALLLWGSSRLVHTTTVNLLWNSIFLFPGALALSAGLLCYGNASFDTSAETFHTRLVREVNQSIRTSLLVDSWRASKDSEHVLVSREIGSQTRPNETHIAIITRTGSLGFSWIERVELMSWDSSLSSSGRHN